MFTSATSVLFKGKSNVNVSSEFFCSGEQTCLHHHYMLNSNAYIFNLRHFRRSQSSVMASSTFTNAYLVDFESVLNIPDNEGMQNMFKALESSGLRGFLGFAGVFELLTEGLSDFSDVPKNLVYDARKLFSKSVEPVVPHGKKKLLKYEYRLLNDILAKSITVKAGSFDAVTNKRFQMMTAIHFGLKVNWSKVLFGVLEEMVDRTVKKAKGYGAQISVLLNSVPALTMGEATPFPSSKILSPKTFLTYIPRTKQLILMDRLKKQPVVEGSEPVVPKKRRTMKGKASASTANMDMASVTQGAVPLQVIEPTPAVTAAQPPAPKRKSRKKKLILSEGSDDDNVEENIDVASVKVAEVNIEEPIEKVSHVSDEVDVIIGQILIDGPVYTDPSQELQDQRLDNQLQAYLHQLVKQSLAHLDHKLMYQSQATVIQSQVLGNRGGSGSRLPARQRKNKIRPENVQYNSKSTTYYEPFIGRLGSYLAGDLRLAPTRITGRLALHGITDSACKNQLIVVSVQYGPFNPYIPIRSTTIGKSRVAIDPIAMHTSWRSNSDIASVTSIGYPRMSASGESSTTMHRLLHASGSYPIPLPNDPKKYFIPGQPWTATASQIIDLLTVAHSKSLEALVAQQKEHGLPVEQPCTSTFLDASVGSGAILAQFYSMAKSTCWVRPLVLIDGAWTPIQGTDFWRSSCKLSLFVNRKKLPETVIEDTFVPHVFFIEPVQYWGAAPALIKTWGWNRVCTDIVRYHMFGCLRPVREYVCTDIVVYNLGIERIPASFRKIFAQDIFTDSFVGYFRDSDVQNISDFEESSSDGSTVYRSPSPLRDEPLALGPGILTVAQEEQLYFVQNPESPPATSPCLETSTSSTSMSMHFDADDIPVDDTADIHTSLPVGRTEFVEAIDDLRAFILQRIDDSNSEILSKLHTLERGLRDTLHDQDANARKLINTDLLSLSTQLGDIVDYIRGGDAKKGEGSSSRRPLPTPVHQSEGTGDAVRITELTQADIGNANRAILERMSVMPRIIKKRIS
ncbi:hypothetical protein F511_31017 [Dorcoceras hygrometricum]|uniref:Uncharacterized protein n=1 Tax=Dorcoceras hygrometricum TaxID=472368 RepID=A0A2Z7A6K2_9LAMI|nr:hypothetical protein F511_31017 [Dorcoceras hygrometricum]